MTKYQNTNFKREFQMSKNHKQLNELGQEPKLQQYQARPVQNYGLSLLKGMGFTEQRGIGFHKQNALTQPLVLKPRPKGLGLGAKPQNFVQQKQQLSKRDYVVIKSEDHKGMVGIIKKIKKQQQLVTVQLSISGTQIKIKPRQLQKITQTQYNEQKQKILKEYKQRAQQNNQKKKKRLKWILPNIRCKVIDKLSPYYLKKVIVTELINQRQFQCLFVSQNGQKLFLKQFTQKQLQTVLPKPPGTVIILDKKFKGQKANLIQRNKDKQEVIVQILQTLEIQNIDENYVSQFVDI